MNGPTLIVLLFIALTLAVHSVIAWSIGDQMSRLGFNRRRWTLFILIGGIPALLVFRAHRKKALADLSDHEALPLDSNRPLSE